MLMEDFPFPICPVSCDSIPDHHGYDMPDLSLRIISRDFSRAFITGIPQFKPLAPLITHALLTSGVVAGITLVGCKLFCATANLEHDFLLLEAITPRAVSFRCLADKFYCMPARILKGKQACSNTSRLSTIISLNISRLNCGESDSPDIVEPRDNGPSFLPWQTHKRARPL